MSLEFALLGFLSHQSMTGYDIKRSFDNSITHIWSADQAQIYRTLRKAQKEKLLTSNLIPQEGKPARKEYTITELGRAALVEWLRSPFEDSATREPFLLRLFFSNHLTDEEVHAFLETRRYQAHYMLDMFEAIKAEMPVEESAVQANRFIFATLLNGIRHVEAELAWLDEISPLFTNNPSQE